MKIVSPHREQTRQVYYGAVHEFKKKFRIISDRWMDDRWANFFRRENVKKSLALFLILFVVFALETKAQQKLPLKLIATTPEIVPGLVESNGSRLSARYATCAC